MSACAFTHAACFSGKIEWQPVSNALAVNLNQLVGFAADMGAAIAPSAAGVLHSYLARLIINDEFFAARFRMAQLNEAAPAVDA